MRKKSIVILLFLNSILLFSQTNSACEKFEINNSNISINEKQYPILIENRDMLTKMYNDIRIEKNCFEDYFEVKCTMQNGNEYRIEYLIYQLDDGFYKQKFQYSLYSNREGHQFYGSKGDNGLLTKINIKENQGILINESNNVQDVDSEVYKSYYSKLVIKYKSNVDILNLLGNPFISKNEKIFAKENVDTINNLAYYLFMSKSYNNSIYLLKNILQKYPNRIVAYLNLADNYWSIKEKEKAIYNYKKYIELIKSQNKDLKKIPQRVWERTK